MDDQQLKQFTPQEARQQLNDNQLERYNELKQQSLKQDIDSQKASDAETSVNGLEAMRESVEKELTVNVRDIEFKADINNEQIKKLSKLAEHKDKKESELSPGVSEELTESMIQVLSELSVNYSRSEWDDGFGDAGIVTLATITYELVDEIEDFMEQKKSR